MLAHTHHFAAEVLLAKRLSGEDSALAKTEAEALDHDQVVTVANQQLEAMDIS